MLLFTPGPVAVKNEILLAGAQAMITHRGAQFQALYKPLITDMITLLNAKEAHLLTGSGTLGIEANFQNALPAGGKCLVLSNGAFGDKLQSHSKLYYETKFARLNDAKGWNLERAKPHIDEAAAAGCKLLAMVHHETSPGIHNKINEICNYAKSKGMLTLVDGTSAWPAYSLDHVKDGVDFYSWASQKSIGCPSGLVGVSHSADAVNAIIASPVRSNFMNLKDYRKNAEKFETPTTPAVSVMYSLKAAFDLLKKEGMENFILRHEKMSEQVRSRLVAMGFKLVIEPGFESRTVTAFFCSKNKDLSSLLQKKYDVKLGGGHADWKDTTLRFCNMGDVDMAKVNSGLLVLEAAKKELAI